MAYAGLGKLHQLTAVQIVNGIASGRFRVEDVVRACLERIQEREPRIQAWESLDAERALAEARRLDGASATGLLHGVPIGVKDVIDTAALPTQMGSALYAGHIPRFDAACVAQARNAGAVVLGKTVTAEFAGTTPTRTRNPRKLEHTPGGSSSGSAAAVADAMIPVAYGTQTGGSVIRPAAFCGVIGFKPTFGTYNPAGIKAAAVSMDTIGLIARDIDDVALFHGVLTGEAPALDKGSGSPMRIGLCRTHLWETVAADTISAIEDVAARLRRSGAPVIDCDLPTDPQRLTEERSVINAYERARALLDEWRGARARMARQTVQICEAGFAVTRERYRTALEYVEDYRPRLYQLFEVVDILITPAAPGEAPRRHDYAGDPRLQELWTLLHLPVLSLPTHTGRQGLPLSIQLVAPRYQETRLFTAGRWILDCVASGCQLR